MNNLTYQGKKISCNVAKNIGETNSRTFSQSTSDGLNYLTNGAIPDEKSNVTHSIMLAGAFMLFNKQTRIIGAIAWFCVLLFWLFGQKNDAVRFRPTASLCGQDPLKFLS